VTGPDLPPVAVWGGAAAIGVIVLIAIILFISHRHGGTGTATNPYPQRVLADIRRLKTDTLPSQQTADIAAARHDMALARQNGTKPATIALYQAQLQQAIDQVDKVTRVTAPVLVANFGTISGSNPTQMASGADIYVLDAGQKAVYSLVPGSNSSPTQIVKAGESDSGIQIGTPVQIATDLSTALVLDDANVLVLDTSGTKSATTLTKSSPAQKVSAMVDNAAGHDVYLFDPVGNQIWKYASAATGVSASPVSILPSSANVGQAVTMTNDDTGIYLLMKNGTVQKYDYTGAKQAFTVPQLRVPIQNPTSIFTDVGLNYIWIADPTNNRIVQLDKKTGKYIRSYEPGTAKMTLSSTSAVVVSSDDKTLYALSGKFVYDFPVVK
jgi:hypothetical protein